MVQLYARQLSAKADYFLNEFSRQHMQSLIAAKNGNVGLGGRRARSPCGLQPAPAGDLLTTRRRQKSSAGEQHISSVCETEPLQRAHQASAERPSGREAMTGKASSIPNFATLPLALFARPDACMVPFHLFIGRTLSL
jgi:hypothetical protein